MVDRKYISTIDHGYKFLISEGVRNADERKGILALVSIASQMLVLSKYRGEKNNSVHMFWKEFHKTTYLSHFLGL